MLSKSRVYDSTLPLLLYSATRLSHTKHAQSHTNLYAIYQRERERKSLPENENSEKKDQWSPPEKKESRIKKLKKVIQ